MPKQQSVWCVVPMVYPIGRDTNSFIEITSKSDSNYAKILIEKVISGAIIAYNPMQIHNAYTNTFDKISINEFKSSLGVSTDTLNVWDDATNKEKTYVIEKKYNANEIKSLGFIENWNFDTSSLRFTKDINAIIINRHYYRREDVDSNEFLVKMVGLIKNPEKHSRKLIPFKTIRFSYDYEKCVSFSSDLCDKDMYSPMLTPFIWSSLIHSILSKIEQNKVTAYDFTSRKPISVDEVLKRMGKIIDTVGTGFGEIMTVEIQPQESEIKAITFTEDWFIDISTGYISKKVKEIGFIREWDDYVTNTHKIRPIFYIKLNNLNKKTRIEYIPLPN